MTKITSQQLHICASVLLDAQGRGAGGRFAGGDQALLQGANFLSGLASATDDTVTVPRELLRQVLDNATENADLVSQLLTHDYAQQAIEADLARIAELRRAAGMEEGE